MVLDLFRKIPGKLPIIDQAIVSGSNFLIGILLAKNLGIEGFGNYSILMLVVLFVLSIQNALFNQPLFTIGPDFEEKKEYLFAVLGAQLIFSVLAGLFFLFLIFLSGIFFKENIFFEYSTIIFLSIIFIALQDFIRRIFFFMEKAIWVITIDIVRYFFLVVLFFFFSLYQIELTIENVFKSILLSSFISFFLGLLFFVSLGFCKISSLFFIGVVKKHIVFAKWLVGSSTVQWFSGNTVVVAAAAIMGPGVVGAIRAAQNIMGGLNVLLLAIENFVPIRAKLILNANGVKNMSAYLFKVFCVKVLFVIVCFFLFFLFNKEIILLLYSEEFIQYQWFIMAYLLVYVFVVANAVLKIWYRTIKKTAYIFFADGLSAIFSVASAYFLVEFYQAIGVLMATYLAAAAITVILFLFSMTLYKNWEKV